MEHGIALGAYINADEIEKTLNAGLPIDLYKYNVKANDKKLKLYFRKSNYAKRKSDIIKLVSKFKVSDNKIVDRHSDGPEPKYSAAILAGFLREMNLNSGNDFSFETVFSHESKLDFLKKAINKGYHVYMYFVCIDDVRVNIERVKGRVLAGGHAVPAGKIRDRYPRVLENLYPALKLSYKAYLFDNSENFREIARLNRDAKIHLTCKPHELPNWFINSVYNKSV
ncbi:MAG TPA: hypothetical protein VFW78_12260 [Bacteroidia bacterium]|nr:hypothetical protein [Bacteroidia bacterium]